MLSTPAFPAGHWMSLGPEAGHVRALAIDPKSPATLYAATDGGGVFKSTDGGTSWQAMNTGLPNTGVQVLAIDPATPTMLYAGTGGGVFKYTLAPLAATLVAPSSTITTVTPTYTWNAVASATDYYLWVNDSNGAKIKTWYTAAQANWPAGTGPCSVTPTTALAAGAGQWWIQTKNAAGTGLLSRPLSFTVSTP